MNSDYKIVHKALSENPIEYLTSREMDYFKKLLTVEDNSQEQSLLQEFEQPDSLINLQDKIIAIEHFKVDSSKTTRKGSSYQAMYNPKRLINRLKGSRNYNTDRNVFISHEKIETDLCYDNLYNNLLYTFDNHYNKNESYIDNINNKTKQSWKKIIFIFFVEYLIVLPSIIKDEDRMVFAYPHNDINFIKFLKSKKKVSGVFFSIPRFNDEPTHIRFIENNKNNLQQYKKKKDVIVDMRKKNIIDFNNPMIMEYGIKPNN